MTEKRLNKTALNAAIAAMDNFAGYDTPTTLAEDCVRAYVDALPADEHTALVAALEDAATALSMATSPETPFRDAFPTCLAAWLKAKQALAALSAEGEKDAPRDELSTLRAKLAEAERALEPFSEVAGEYFARNYDDSSVIATLYSREDDGSGGSLTITFAHLRKARTALSSIRGEDAPKDDGWIEWKGGECPVSGSTEVEIKTVIDDKNGLTPTVWDREGSDEAGWFDRQGWWGGGNRVTIIAYRVVKP